MTTLNAGAQQVSDGNGFGKARAVSSVVAVILTLGGLLVGLGTAYGIGVAGLDDLKAARKDHDLRIQAVERQFNYVAGQLDAIARAVNAMPVHNANQPSGLKP